MEQRFKYNMDKRTRQLTWIWSFAGAMVFASLFLELHDNYLRAWIIFILIALLLLYVMSIPRYVLVNREALEIHCVVEMTRIAIEDISIVRKVTRREIAPLLIVMGSYGFFGYYGYYVNFKRWDTIKIYATEMKNLVEIEDIYEQKYIISCRQADRLIETVMQAKLIHAGEHAGSTE